MQITLDMARSSTVNSVAAQTNYYFLLLGLVDGTLSSSVSRE